MERSLLIGQQLADSRPAWIASVARGDRLILIGQFLPLIAIPADMLGSRLQVEAVAFAVLAAAAGCYCAGSWLLTRRENPHAARQPQRGLSLCLRVLSIGPFVVVVLFLARALLLAWTDDPWHFRRVPLWMADFDVEQYLSYLGIILFLPCPLLQFRIMKRLAQRVLNRYVSGDTAIVGVGHPFSVAAIVLWYWLVFDTLNSSVQFVVTLLLWVAFLLFWMWSAYVHVMFGKAFRQAALPAMASWKAADAADSGTAD